MANPTEGELRIVGTSQIYAGDKMIAFAAIKDVPDFDERMANLKGMAAWKDLKDACTQMLWALDNNDDVELENGKASARIAIQKAATNTL